MPCNHPSPTARICFLLEYEGFSIGVGSRNDRWLNVDVQGSPQAPSGGALYTEFSTLAELANNVPLLDGLAWTATSAVEVQACRMWIVMIKAKILPGMVAKGTLDRCTVQGISRKFTHDYIAITPMPQSAHIIATPFDVHQVLRTLGVVQMQPVAPPMVHTTTPPSCSSGSTSKTDIMEKVIPLRDIVWVGAPFAAVVNNKVDKCANRMRSTIMFFAFSKAQCGALKLPCPTHRDLKTSQCVVIGTTLHMNNKDGMPRFMNCGTVEATFAYQEVQWVDPDFEDNGSWSVDVSDMEAILDLLHKKHIQTPVCRIKLYGESLVGEPVATRKEGQRAYTHGSTSEENFPTHGISHWLSGDPSCRGTTLWFLWEHRLCEPSRISMV